MKIAVVQSPRFLRGILRSVFGLRDRDCRWDDRHDCREHDHRHEDHYHHDHRHDHRDRY